MRLWSSVWVRRLGVAALVAVALGYVPYHLYGSSGLAHYVKLERERDALHEANLKTHAANQQLRAELEALGDGETDGLSPAAVERAARDELGLVKTGEVVYKVQARGEAAR
ncbi:MAG TPA: septum formation initiator family protein [Polyangia bacterium]|jgi:cell division protein FtsB|nr:septum formation initiator family protein [Polyangia bacterium]